MKNSKISSVIEQKWMKLKKKQNYQEACQRGAKFRASLQLRETKRSHKREE